MRLVKTDNDNLAKDIESGALLNVNNDALHAYKKRKNKEAEFDLLKEKVEGLQNDISEIKTLLKNIFKENK